MLAEKVGAMLAPLTVRRTTPIISDLPGFPIHTPSINPLKVVLLCSELCSGLYIAIN